MTNEASVQSHDHFALFVRRFKTPSYITGHYLDWLSGGKTVAELYHWLNIILLYQTDNKIDTCFVFIAMF